MTAGTYLDAVRKQLEAIKSAERYREISAGQAQWSADFSTNDYLGLSTDSRMIEAMRFLKRVGSGGARLLGGAHREQFLLEQDIAGWLGRERALLFSSGYLAALGVVQVLASCTNRIYSDELNHASLIDGIRATGKPREIYAHGKLPPKAQRAPGALIVTESLFGMDGDVVDIAAYAADLHDGDVLLVDEAHALGVFGARGAGFASSCADSRVVVLGTLGKAIGASGGFIAGKSELIDLLVNAARTFIFDTAPPPGLAFAARVGIMIAQGADDLRTRLLANVDYLREGLQSLGYRGVTHRTPIVPVIFGDERAALEAMNAVRDRRVNAPAVRPPTVPAGTSRLRISIRANHLRENIDLLTDALRCSTVTL